MRGERATVTPGQAGASAAACRPLQEIAAWTTMTEVADD
jgi:hypothetical protein